MLNKQDRLKGRLFIGLPVETSTGTVRCYDFVVNILTMADELNALERIETMGLSDKAELTKREEMLADFSYLVEQITFEGLDKAQLTPEFLLNNLATDDYVLIMGQISTLRGKCIAAGENPMVA